MGPIQNDEKVYEILDSLQKSFVLLYKDMAQWGQM